jgi:hypothetical protein
VIVVEYLIIGKDNALYMLIEENQAKSFLEFGEHLKSKNLL